MPNPSVPAPPTGRNSSTSRPRAPDRQELFDLPSPLLADPDAMAGQAYGQPVWSGIGGDLSDFLGRTPEAIVADLPAALDGPWG